MKNNLGVWITVAIFFIGIVTGFGKLQANVSTNDRDIDKLKDKVEDLSENTTTINAQQESIIKMLDKLDNRLEKVADKVGAKK